MRGTGKTLVAVEFMTSSSTDTVTATAICLGSGEDARGRGISRLAPVLEKRKTLVTVEFISVVLER